MSTALSLPIFSLPHRSTTLWDSTAIHVHSELGQHPTDKEFFEVVSTVDTKMKGMIGEGGY